MGTLLDLYRRLVLLEDVASQVGPLISELMDQLNILFQSSSLLEQRIAAVSKIIELTGKIREIVKPVLGASPKVIYSAGPNEEAELRLAIEQFAWEGEDDLPQKFGARGEFIKKVPKNIIDNPDKWVPILLTILA